MSDAGMGKKISDITKEKLRKFNIGKKLSLEHRIKIGEANKKRAQEKRGLNA
jgi:hypothetical protein